MCASWAVMPSTASIINKATSQRSMARMERTTLNFSTPGSTLPRRRMPAVSINVIGIPSYSIFVSTASRVVPGILLTMERSSPTRRLSKLDFPTLGFPTMAIFTESSSTSCCCCGSTFNRSSSKSPVPVPCTAEMG